MKRKELAKPQYIAVVFAMCTVICFYYTVKSVVL